MMARSFQDQLRFGQTAESDIAKWLMAHGYSVMPVYEKLVDTGKGPQLFTAKKSLVAPDMFVFDSKQSLWLEAKHKTAFSWHRITERWVTGIDLRHYRDYCEIDDSTPFPVWLMFLHRGGQAKGHPDWAAQSPSGLFMAPIRTLRKNENHRHDNWGRSGMVYWAREEDGGALRKVADLEEIVKPEAA